ncbi:MAG: glycosyltransferase family 2 protein [Bacteroidia bacterium]|nr:glycosyltransferase family 2 protein [Bacteroidia bacterium]
MHKLSVVIITYNEEKNLQRCLDSVAEIADEILIVDSHSTDKTAEIGRANGARLILHTFEGHVAQKNIALTQARYDLVLSLDADEALDEAAQSEVKEIKEKWAGEAYIFRRRNNYCGKWIRFGGWYPDKKLRLLDRNKGKWTGRNPHDKLEVNADIPVKELKSHILHYTIANREEHLKTVHAFSTYAAEAKFEAGKKASLLKVFFAPIFKFLKGYLFQLGFLDGYKGLQIAVISAYASYLRYKKLREMWGA